MTQRANRILSARISDDGIPFIAMELLDGRTLGESSATRGACRSFARALDDDPTARPTVSQIADLLDALASSNVSAA